MKNRMIQRGWIPVTATPEPTKPEQPSLSKAFIDGILDKPISKVLKVLEGFEGDDLKQIIEAEKADKNRKGIINIYG